MMLLSVHFSQMVLIRTKFALSLVRRRFASAFLSVQENSTLFHDSMTAHTRTSLSSHVDL